MDIDADQSIADLTAAALSAARSAGLLLEPVGQNTILTEAEFEASSTARARSWLADPVTDAEFDLRATVRSAGLEDGDLVVLCVEHPPEAMYSLMPAPNTAHLFAQLQLADAVEDAPKIRGVLLYTDADVELATFVRTHFDELNALSGELFQIFVHERPVSWRRAKRYWKPRTRPQLYRLLAALQWLKWIPYDASDVYENARRFGVRLSDLPCLVLFNPIGAGENFVFPLQNASLSEFRRLFGHLSETIHGGRPAQAALEQQLDRSRDWEFAWTGSDSASPAPGRARKAAVDDAVLERLMQAEERFRAELARSTDRAVGTFEFKGATVIINSGGDSMTENFNFHGPTTFINRPVNTVVRDFQNSYSTAPAGQDLASLLELVLSSEELDDSGREAVARLIHELADELGAAQTEPEDARHKLERIKTTVGRAADIAAPALGIVSKIFELLP
ncbi:hypothetical protein [Kribbella sp. DT2]|uniref:hypothetical protein n=1 Tax=Kribbella sp. DT2 TaxID=3393427 RepID=UPI003CEC8FA8